MSDIVFGTVSLRSGVSNQTSGTLSINCTGVGSIGVCIVLASGSGGSGAGFSPRFMRRADSAALAYELRPGGNGASGGTWDREFVRVPTVLGTGRIDVPVFADITSSGVGTGTGAYSTTFSGTAQAHIEFNTNSCNQPGTVRQINAFDVTADVAASCEVDAGAIDFGTLAAAAVTSTVAATGGFVIRCTQGTGYTVSLDNGVGAGASGPTDRRMTGPASQQLRYGLYLNGSVTTPWGQTPGQTVATTGTGNDQTMTVHGRLFAGQPLRAGVYTDSVLITVEY
ncbi:spore coat U domain-containing protein (plasmid) [Sulfitobacter sp. S190]|nr:spore coat U domain-containing protein [Sulfitobacter sp. S190]